MTKPISFGRLDFELVSSMGEAHHGLDDPETPFRLLIMGDFSGRAGRGIFDPAAALSKRRIRPVDQDNLEEVMAYLGVEILLPLAGETEPPTAIRFTELDDFRPDRIFDNLPLFGEIRETRGRLNDPAWFAKAVAERQKSAIKSASTANSEGAKDSLGKLTQESTADLLDQILDDSDGGMPASASNRRASEWDGFLKRIVEPHLVPDVEPAQDALLAAVDEASGDLMRAVLHFPAFQGVEAAWRGLDFLVSRIETDERLQLYLLDISKEELAADLCSTDDLAATGTYRILVEETVETLGAEPWGLLAGIYTVAANRDDAEILGRLAKIAAAAGAPFIAAADNTLPGCGLLETVASAGGCKGYADAEGCRVWEAFRKQPEASFIGLALPRFLLRLPYGEETDTIESFAFEEMEESPDHSHYLWGNPAFACALLLAQSFSAYGWQMRPGIILEIEDLPLHVYKEEGESRTKPCAEVLLTEADAEEIMEKGVIPLLSFKNRDRVRVARFQSVADPPASLAGRWDRGSNS
jgi:type VI secretion system protein ImpC